MVTNPRDTVTGVVNDLTTIYADAMSTAPRSLQTTLGPSELGCACDRCLIHMLAGTPRQHADRDPWLPTIGTAVHAWLEEAMIRYLQATGSDRFIPEMVVTVGDLRGRPVTGTADLFDTKTGTVIDFKVAGKTTLNKVRVDGSGARLTYQRQVQLYGAGATNAGLDVRNVAIWFLPRNAVSITQGRLFATPFDPADAAATLARADQFAAWVDGMGADQVLAAAAPHTHEEFSCATFPDGAKPLGEVTPEEFLGVA